MENDDEIEIDDEIDFIWKARVTSFARLLQILTDVFFENKNREALSKIEGAEFNAIFPKMGNNGASIKIIDKRIHPFPTKTKNAIGTLIFNMEYEEMKVAVGDIVHTKSNLLGLSKIFFKYLLPRKIKMKGALFKLIRVVKVIMLGNHPMYKKEKELKEQ